MHYINKLLISIVALILALLCCGCSLLPAFASSYPYTYTGTVTKIYDGDTLTVRDQDGQLHCIRLASIDAPEKDQPYGQEATLILKQLLLHRKVTVTVRDLDKYNRQVAHVYYNQGVDTSATLLERGAAWHFSYFDKDDSHYLLHKQLQQSARQEKIGLWSDPLALPPWQWRRL